MNSNDFAADVVNRLSSVVLPSESAVVSLHQPEFAGNEWNYVKECLDTGWVSSVGKFVDQFERKLEEVTGAVRAITTVNGTAALHICLIAAGVQPGDEVLIPALTFVATANAVKYCFAEPHFVDSSEISLGICPQRLRVHLGNVARLENGVCRNKLTGRIIRAFVPMHVFGHSVDLDPLMEICKEFGITLIEDAAESLGTYYKGRHTGTLGKLGALSFNGNKIVTTGGGGAILTMDEELGASLKHLTTTAKKNHKWEFFHDHIGYNYRMPNINAALGCAQIERLSDFVTRKRRLAETYQGHFKGFSGLTNFVEPIFSRSNYWLNALVLDPSHSHYRDRILQLSNDAGIACRPVWLLMNKLPMYNSCPSADLSIALSLEKRIINIPSSASLDNL